MWIRPRQRKARRVHLAAEKFSIPCKIGERPAVSGNGVGICTAHATIGGDPLSTPTVANVTPLIGRGSDHLFEQNRIGLPIGGTLPDSAANGDRMRRGWHMQANTLLGSNLDAQSSVESVLGIAALSRNETSVLSARAAVDIGTAPARSPDSIHRWVVAVERPLSTKVEAISVAISGHGVQGGERQWRMDCDGREGLL
eukprot:scaffold20582_cov29-Tisochrysis_lutea.AAC.2